MKRNRIVVIGAGFAGFAGALELKSRLGDRHDVTVLSPSDRFVFTPSLIWVPFGLRGERITFDLRDSFGKRGIRFVKTEVVRLSLENRLVTTRNGEERYDHLLIATGSKPNYAAVPGLGPRGYTQSIMTLPEAEKARAAFGKFLEAPGPVVIGAAQGASRPGFVHEFLFNMGRALRFHGVADKAPLFHLDAEPSLEGFEAEGSDAARVANDLFERLGIQSISNATIRQIGPREIVLGDGRRIPFAYAMVVPSLLGVDAVRACERVTDATGFVRVNHHCQTLAYPEVFAAGVAVSHAPADTPLTRGVAGSGHRAEEMARIAAGNIAARIEERSMTELPAASIDARSDVAGSRPRGLVPLEDLLDRRPNQWSLPGPEADWASRAFERFFSGEESRGERGI